MHFSLRLHLYGSYGIRSSTDHGDLVGTLTPELATHSVASSSGLHLGGVGPSAAQPHSQSYLRVCCDTRSILWIGYLRPCSSSSSLTSFLIQIYVQGEYKPSINPPTSTYPNLEHIVVGVRQRRPDTISSSTVTSIPLNLKENVQCDVGKISCTEMSPKLASQGHLTQNGSNDKSHLSFRVV